jgi:predicted ribosome quality control (RQC) complex YloA/Tae2 family protein
MPLDGAMLHTVLHELQNTLIDGRIDKVLQPERDELYLLIRARGENIRLLCSASPANPRIHIAQINKPNPGVPPAFCMLLRKHLAGGRIADITQPDTDRIIRLHIQSRNELGDYTEKQLIVEIMGRYSNILLTQDGAILDCIKHIGADVNRYREILPGKPYVSPPGQGKRDPFALDVPLPEVVEKEGDLARALKNAFFGLSPQSAVEIVYRVLGTEHVAIPSLTSDQWNFLDTAFRSFFKGLTDPSPLLILDETGVPRDLLPFPYRTYEGAPYMAVPSPSACVEGYYRNRDMANRMAQRTAHLVRTVKTALERSEKKLANQKEDYAKAERGDKYRLYGELLTAHMHNLEEGQSSATVPNYYDKNEGTMTIPLDPARTINQNAQRYFKRYAKTRNALTQLALQIPQTEAEIAYLEGQLQNLSQCETDAEVNEIAQELMDEGYMKRRRRQEKKTAAPSKPLHYVSSDGYDIYVGKNNRQNDWLTFKKASAADLWLHAKEMPGSHVIIRTQGQPLEDIPDTTLTEAAQLAAWYSKGRTGSHIPIDYCPRSHVKKPGTYKPGLVIYEGYYTVYVDPRKEAVEGIRTGD